MSSVEINDLLAIEEITATQRVSHRTPDLSNANPTRSWSQRSTKKVSGSHHVDHPLLLKPAGIKIATKSLPGPTMREWHHWAWDSSTPAPRRCCLFSGRLSIRSTTVFFRPAEEVQEMKISGKKMLKLPNFHSNENSIVQESLVFDLSAITTVFVPYSKRTNKSRLMMHY